MKPKRTDRLASQLLREVSDILMRKLSDPRLTWVTLVRADVSPDMRESRIFVRTLETGEKQAKTMEALAHAVGFIRHELGNRLEWRLIPNLHFILDTETDRAEAVLRKIEQLHAESEGRHSDGGTETGA